jgi:hypothetical protein
MSLRWYSVVIDSRDPAKLARWWAQALDWQIAFEADDEVVVIPKWAAELETTLRFDQVPPGLVFGTVPEAKTVKNRLHIDLAPHLDDDRDGEIQRLVRLGATTVDVGQGPDVTWTVLADPEGNEFCVLSSRER